MNFLIAPDKFKGSLTAVQAAAAIRRGVERAAPDARCREMPIADGGEGTAEALLAATGGEWITTSAHDCLGRPVEASYAWLPGGVAAIDMSNASGLWRVAANERDILRASTFGTGELVLHAARRGAREIFVGLGGSATNDGGLGLAAALGWRFVAADGTDLPPLPVHLPGLARIVPPADAAALPPVVAMCDVGNPLLGPGGATWTYGCQKGGDDTTLPALEAALTRLAEVKARDGGRDHRDTPGAGAAGGLGFGLLAFCGAELRSGFETVAEAIGLWAAVAESDLVLTGEGSLDTQTLHGKGPAGVARLARGLGKPVLAFGGQVLSPEALLETFDGVFALREGSITLEEAIRRAGPLLEEKAAAAVAAWRQTRLAAASRPPR